MSSINTADPAPTRGVRVNSYGNYSEKPLPQPRPDTSGTEGELQINIRRAEEDLRQARRAERLYRARKKTATARANRTEAKDHFHQSAEHFRLGVRLGWAVIMGVPAVMRQQRELRRLEAEEASDEKQGRRDGKLAAHDEPLRDSGEGAKSVD